MSRPPIISRIRRRLRRSSLARSYYTFAVQLGQAVTWSRSDFETQLEQTYLAAEDPWDYASSDEEARKYDLCVEMVRGAADKVVPQALEVGCSEGLFTARLAPLCSSVLAVDVSPLALQRAVARCTGLDNVRFERWRLPDGGPLGQFDLVICTDTLAMVAPLQRRRAIKLLAEMVSPGGHLIVGEYVHPEIENAAWGRVLLSVAKHVVDRFGSSSVGMTLCRIVRTDRHIVALYRQPV